MLMGRSPLTIDVAPRDRKELSELLGGGVPHVGGTYSHRRFGVQMKESSDKKLSGAEGRLGITEETYAFPLTYALIAIIAFCRHRECWASGSLTQDT
jgi:hypothetical protein